MLGATALRSKLKQKDVDKKEKEKKKAHKEKLRRGSQEQASRRPSQIVRSSISDYDYQEQLFPHGTTEKDRCLSKDDISRRLKDCRIHEDRTSPKDPRRHSEMTRSMETRGAQTPDTLYPPKPDIIRRKSLQN